MSNDFKNFEKLLPEFITDRVDDNARQCIRWKFSNGYGASLICHPMSYGGTAEFATLKEDKLCYDTPITSDVISHVTVHEVMGYLARLRGM
jgi:hypothetical protein